MCSSLHLIGRWRRAGEDINCSGGRRSGRLPALVLSQTLYAKVATPVIQRAVMDNEVGTWSFGALIESHECTVCFEMKEGTAFPDAPLTGACKHRPSTCLDCIRSCIRCDLATKLWSEVACPECESWLAPDALQRYADDESWRKYNELSLRKVLEADKNFVWAGLPPTPWA